MYWLISVLGWRARQSPLIRWALALSLFSIALVIRGMVSMLQYGGMPALTFLPLLLVTAFVCGWKEATAFLTLSTTASWYLLTPDERIAVPLGWGIGGGVLIVVITGLQSMVLDLINANERQRLLFSELQHRVANTLQRVLATVEVANIRIDRNPMEAKHILTTGAQRIAASAEVHRRLHDPSLFENDFATILRDAIAGIVPEPIKVTLQVDKVPLSFDQASTMVMLVIEGANNATKHVFRHGLGEHFMVSLHQNGGTILLTIGDDGPGWSGVAENSSLGTTILHELVRQLDGTLSVGGHDGTIIRIAFPVRGHERHLRVNASNGNA